MKSGARYKSVTQCAAVWNPGLNTELMEDTDTWFTICVCKHVFECMSRKSWSSWTKSRKWCFYDRLLFCTCVYTHANVAHCWKRPCKHLYTRACQRLYLSAIYVSLSCSHTHTDRNTAVVNAVRVYVCVVLLYEWRRHVWFIHVTSD